MPWKQEVVDQWFADDGDNTHRLNYPLNEDSVIVEIGAYDGEFTKKLWDKFHCKIHAFEPMTNPYHMAATRLEGTPVQLYRKAVSDHSGNEFMAMAGPGSSFILDRSEMGYAEKVTVIDVVDVLQQIGEPFIDLMVINIEGAEYDLLDKMLDYYLHIMVGNLQIQFHDYFHAAEDRMIAIQNRLSLTHVLTYQYPFCFENWELQVD